MTRSSEVFHSSTVVHLIDRSVHWRPSHFWVNLRDKLPPTRFPVSLGTVREVDGYFSTLAGECAVVIEEHRGHRLLHEFLSYSTAVFSLFLPPEHSLSLLSAQLTIHSPASQDSVQLPWRTWRYLTHLARGEAWRRPRSSGLEMSFFLRPVLRPLCSTGTVVMWSVDVVVIRIHVQLNIISSIIFSSRVTFYPQYLTSSCCERQCGVWFYWYTSDEFLPCVTSSSACSLTVPPIGDGSSPGGYL